MLPAIELCNALLRMSKLHGHRHLRNSCQSSLFRHRPLVFPYNIIVFFLFFFEAMQQSLHCNLSLSLLLSWLTVPLAVLAYRGERSSPMHICMTLMGVVLSLSCKCPEFKRPLETKR